MPNESWPKVKEILAEALDLPKDQRGAFLDSRCGTDLTLRREVESYLRAGELSEGKSGLPIVPTQTPPVDGPHMSGNRIGRYHVKRLIGTGGMGAVYEAVQEQPRRTVAVKVMKRGIASRSALRRFEYEAQLLARLRHPGIAQVYEAGTHDDGTGAVPFFVLEYIPGARTLTDYAREKSLGTRQRLELFCLVCDAIHHGHQKGIIHRDLKPANILVDSAGQPKIIDFGVARATDSDLAVTTLQTDVGQLVGTLQYMSPEQCEADPHDIDTRSDVYALGVILYELLCGRLPYTLESKSVIEAARTVRDQAPARPSTVSKLLRGDLETIILKALEKDRDRRYRSASELADDIGRYTRSEPISARPPSVSYQVRMFARRHRTLVAAIGVILVVLAGAVAGISWSLVQTKAARARAQVEADNAKEISEFLRNILILPNPSIAQSHKFTVEEALDMASTRVSRGIPGRPEVESDIRAIIGATYRSLGNYDAAESHLQAAAELRSKNYGPADPTALAMLSQVAGVKNSRGKSDDAAAILRSVLDRQERSVGRNDAATLRTVSELGWTLYNRRDLEECERLFRRLHEGSRVTFGPDSPAAIKAACTLAMVLIDNRKLDNAEPLVASAIDRARVILGEKHPDYLYAINIRAWLLRNQGKYDESVSQYLSLTAAADQIMGADHPYALFWKAGMAWTMILGKRYAEAEPVFRQVLDVVRRKLGPDHPDALDAQVGLGRSLVEQDKLVEAEPLLLSVFDRAKSVGPAGERSLGEAAIGLTHLYERSGKPERAAEYRPLIPASGTP